MSLDTVKRTFAKLEKQGYLISGNFNKDPRDKTKWYTIDEEIQAIKEKILKAKEEKEVIDNTKLTRELMGKYIDSVSCEGNEVLNIIWK